VAGVFYLLIAGIGIGCIIQVRVLGIQATVKRENIAVATATSNFMMNLGGTIGIAVAGTIFTNQVWDN
jgi:predicted MFS family arabinose efflux permease